MRLLFFHALGYRPGKEDAGGGLKHGGEERGLMLPLFCLPYSGIMVARRNSDINFQGFFSPTDTFPPTYFIFLVLEGEAVKAQL